MKTAFIITAVALVGMSGTADADGCTNHYHNVHAHCIKLYDNDQDDIGAKCLEEYDDKVKQCRANAKPTNDYRPNADLGTRNIVVCARGVPSGTKLSGERVCQ
jgi:hypothetical protein